MTKNEMMLDLSGEEQDKVLAIIEWYDYYNEWKNTNINKLGLLDKINYVIDNDIINEFRFFPDVFDDGSLGEELVDMLLSEIDDEKIKKGICHMSNHLDYDSYGQSYINSSEGIFTDYGFVEPIK